MVMVSSPSSVPSFTGVRVNVAITVVVPACMVWLGWHVLGVVAVLVAVWVPAVVVAVTDAV